MLFSLALISEIVLYSIFPTSMLLVRLYLYLTRQTPWRHSRQVSQFQETCQPSLPVMLLSLESTPTHQTLSRHSRCMSYCSCSHQLPSRLLQLCSLWRTSICHTQTPTSLKLSRQNSSPVRQSSPLRTSSTTTSLATCSQQIRFKLATITYKALCTNSPQYLASHIHYHQSVRSLHSSDQQFLVPTPSSTNFGSRSFRSAAPVIWNSLPLAIHTSPTINTFKRSLKTHYFCFPPV